MPTYERVDPAGPPFEIVPGIVITPGAYHFTRCRVEAQSAQTRGWRVGSTVWFGDFYGGRLTQTEVFVNWDVLRGHLHQKLDLENDFGHLPEGDFRTSSPSRRASCCSATSSTTPKRGAWG